MLNQDEENGQARCPTCGSIKRGRDTGISYCCEDSWHRGEKVSNQDEERNRAKISFHENCPGCENNIVMRSAYVEGWLARASSLPTPQNQEIERLHGVCRIKAEHNMELIEKLEATERKIVFEAQRSREEGHEVGWEEGRDAGAKLCDGYSMSDGPSPKGLAKKIRALRYPGVSSSSPKPIIAGVGGPPLGRFGNAVSSNPNRLVETVTLCNRRTCKLSGEQIPKDAEAFYALPECSHCGGSGKEPEGVSSPQPSAKEKI